MSKVSLGLFQRDYRKDGGWTVKIDTYIIAPIKSTILNTIQGLALPGIEFGRYQEAG